MEKNAYLIIGVAVVAVIIVAIILLLLLLAPSCTPGPPYEIRSEQSPTPPLQFVEIQSSEIEQYPLIGNVIEAQHNPDQNHNATFKNAVLHYAVFNETELHRTEYFLWTESQNGPHPPMPSPMPIDHVLYVLGYDRNDGNGLQYYTWQAFELDSGC